MSPKEELKRYIQNAIEEEDAGYSEEYRNSKWYKKPGLKDAFSDPIARDITALSGALETGSDTTSFVSVFEEKASECGRSWYDEDLGMVRTGWEWETKVYTFLRNIAARSSGLPEKEWRQFYEGYTG